MSENNLADTNRSPVSTTADVHSSGKTECVAGVNFYWAVMRAYQWSSLSVGGHKLTPPKDGGPSLFIPVFNSREEAVKFAGGESEVMQMSRAN